MTDKTAFLPCPFCGSEAELRDYGDEFTIWIDHKDGCWMEDYEGYADLPADEKQEVIEAWNTRYEPTCHIAQHGGTNDFIVCESCDECDYGWHRSVNDKPYSFCPSCGSKVTKECTMNRVYLYDEEAVEGIECSECGWGEIHDHKDPLPDTCPNCKAKVIEG